MERVKEKIIKLLKSNTYGDIYIGLKLLNDLPRGKIPHILREIGFQRGDKHITWRLSFEGEVDVPLDMESQYIEGNFYHYALTRWDIIIDAPSDVKWTLDYYKGKINYQVVESWKTK